MKNFPDLSTAATPLLEHQARMLRGAYTPDAIALRERVLAELKRRAA